MKTVSIWILIASGVIVRQEIHVGVLERAGVCHGTKCRLIYSRRSLSFFLFFFILAIRRLIQEQQN